MSRLLYGIGLRITNFLVFFFIIVLLPGLPPKTYFPLAKFEITPPRELNGSLDLNNHLDNAERLLEGRVYGPECLISRNNEIFTGIHGGEVIKITADHITHVAKFGQPCEGVYQEEKCGRPLGMAFDANVNNLIVSDAYYGIWQVDISNGKKKLLISPYQTFDGKIQRKAGTFNSVAVDKRGDIYWTDSTSDFTIEDVVYAMFTNPSGRLFHYDRSKNVSKLLIDELYFANGIALSPNEDFIIVAETGASRILKYHLKGPRKGQYEVFVDGLPGAPDNLTPDANGIWVPLVTACDADHPSIFHVLAPFPMIRSFIVRIFSLLELPSKFINNVFPNKYAQNVIHAIGHFEVATGLIPKRTTILRVDWNGNIIGSLHGFDKSVRFVSHVLELEDSLLLGSPINSYLAKVKNPRGPQVKIRNVKYESADSATPDGSKQKAIPKAKPAPTPKTTTPTQKTTTTTTTTTTPKPTTTTQKPTTTTQKPTTTTPKPTTTTQEPTTPTPVVATKKTTSKPANTTPPPTAATTTTKPASSKPPTKASKTESTKPTAKAPSPTPPIKPKEPAPIKEDINVDAKPPGQPKLKVIKKGGEHGEL